MSCALLRLASGPRARPRRLRAAATASTACTAAPLQRGVVLGVHTEEGREGFTLTEQAAAFDRKVSGRFSALLKLGPPLAAGQARVLWGVDGAHAAVAAAGLGARAPPDEPHEGIDRRAENVRLAAGAGCRALREAGARAVLVDAMGAPRAAAEGATLAAYRYQEYRQQKKRKHVPAVSPLAECDAGEWSLGAEGAGSQNWSRTLMERPGNKLTPTEMARVVSAELSALSVKCLSRDRAWAESMNMNCFLSVSRGSAEPPVFLELHYDGPASKAAQPIVLVGKGVTFDSGGISIKPSAKMAEMRGDMGGAAVVCGAIRAAAALRLPVKLIGLIPLTENMPGGAATKPGDVFVARNGKSVLVDNTDAEGRLILADALCYAHDFDPLVTVDLATLTGAMRVALGDAASGLFTRDERLASALRRAAAQSADRVWRMPLYQRYTDRVTGYEFVDVHNVGKGSGGGACTAAAFLREFAPAHWAHLDIAGVMADTEDQPYLGPGMTGRPLRTILEFVRTFNEQK